jgi:hypothetical protein
MISHLIIRFARLGKSHHWSGCSLRGYSIHRAQLRTSPLIPNKTADAVFEQFDVEIEQ